MARDRPLTHPIETLVTALASGEDWARIELHDALTERQDWAKKLLHEALQTEAPWARETFLLGLRAAHGWAFEGFYAWYLPRIEKICRQLIDDPIAARDCAHDLALVFVDEVVHMPGPLTSFPGYLWTMVFRRGIRYQKKRRGFTSGPEGDGGPAVHEPRLGKNHAPEVPAAVDDAAHQRILMRELERAIARLDQKEQALLADRHARGFTLEELARRDGVSFQAIYKREARLLESLRKGFRKLGLMPRSAR